MSIEESNFEDQANPFPLRSSRYKTAPLSSSERSESLDKLRAFTEQLEDSLEKAQRQGGRKAARPNQALLMEIAEQMPSALETIRCALSDMTSLSNSMRTLSYLGTRPLKLEPLNSEAIVAELIRTNNLFIETNRVTVEIGNLHDVVADQQSFQDILQGLFDNALKYLDPLRNGVIKLSSQRAVNYTTFMISDNGRGIREEDSVFDVFKRSDEVVHISGEGMGIPFVETLVRRHLGRLWYNSEYGEGTTFFFTIENKFNSHSEMNRGDQV